MARSIGRVAILLAVTALLWTAVRAAQKDAPPKKDPVSSAFALPRGLVLTPPEMAWANSVRSELEPKLRDALRRVEQGADSEQKAKAAVEVRQIKSQIKQAINAILQDRAAKAAAEYAKKVAKAKKKRAAANKKRNKRKKNKRHKKRRRK